MGEMMKNRSKISVVVLLGFITNNFGMWPTVNSNLPGQKYEKFIHDQQKLEEIQEMFHNDTLQLQEDPAQRDSCCEVSIYGCSVRSLLGYAACTAGAAGFLSVPLLTMWSVDQNLSDDPDLSPNQRLFNMLFTAVGTLTVESVCLLAGCCGCAYWQSKKKNHQRAVPSAQQEEV